ncbi:MAG TPA: hypothetical protein VIV11_39005 [Kofleriaceae bacterium]
MAGLAVALAACSFDHGTAATMSDGKPADGNGDGAMPPDVMLGGWSMPVEIAELNSGTGDDDPSLTANLQEIFWGSRRGSDEDIWTATRSSPTATWGSVQVVSALSSNDTETTMKVTSDGLAMYFTRDVMGSIDIWAAARRPLGTTWESVARVDALSTASPDYGAHVRADLLRVVMCRGATVADETLVEAERADVFDAWSGASRIAPLDEFGISECDPMEPRPNVLYFASNRGGGYDIYRSERASSSQPWGPIMPVAGVNVANADDRDPWVSADERYMVFSSTRLGASRLFVTTR